jgi:hypothetical protein
MGNPSFNKVDPTFSGVSKTFIPGLRSSHSPNNTTKYTVTPNRSYTGTFVPNVDSVKTEWVATADECADECSKNENCSIAQYSSNDFSCQQYLDDDNMANNLVPSGPHTLVLKKNPDPRVKLHGTHSSDFIPLMKTSTIDGGTHIKNITLNSSQRASTVNPTPADVCAKECIDYKADGCDGFTYNTNSGVCSLYNMGDCTNPSSPACGTIQKPALDPLTYATKMSQAGEGAEFKLVHQPHGKVRCDYYCGKNFGGDLPGDWSNAGCAGAFQTVGSNEERISCTSATGRPMACKCYKKKGNYWYKESENTNPSGGNDWAGHDGNDSPWTRWVAADGTCDGNNVCWKNWGPGGKGTAMGSHNQAESWKGARCTQAGVLDLSGGKRTWKRVPCNQAIREVPPGAGNTKKFYVQCAADNNPYITGSAASQCASGETSYACVIL